MLFEAARDIIWAYIQFGISQTSGVVTAKEYAMNRSKKLLLIGILLCVCLIMVFLYVAVKDFCSRHYAFDGYSDRITVFLFGASAEKPIATDEYILNCNGNYACDHLQKSHNFYSMNGDYGTYFFRLQYKDKTASFFLENTNDWWRTIILLRLSDDGGTEIQQMNIIYNNNPPFVESRLIEWE